MANNKNNGNLTEEDVDKKFNTFLEHCIRCSSEDKKKSLIKAYNFAKSAHKGQTRYNGNVFISHPVEVANIVTTEIGLGTTSATAALLHDTVTDTDAEIEDIETIFGNEIATLVEHLVKIKGTSHFFSVNKSEVYKRLLVGISEDIRVIYIKIADRLHNMRTLNSLDPEEKHRVASETMYVYAPLAIRLGLYSIKSELEDLAFKYLSPYNYNQIAQQIKDSHFSNIMYLNRAALPIIYKLRKAGYDFDINSRQKTIYSIWQKIKRKGITFREVYDFFAFRIIFKPKDENSEKEDCFKIKEIINSYYEIKEDRTRDWVNSPKENGYEALHVTVRGPNDRWIEIQIRSQRMHDIAEHGFASHWQYKGIEFKKIKFNEKILELRKKMETLNEDDFDFVSNFKLLFTTEIVAYTPKGKEIILPTGATALDFAFYIHTELGLKAIAAKVNNNTVTLDYQLQNGDYVYIITAQKQEPQSEWIEFVRTQKAKQAIHNYLGTERINEKELGMSILFSYINDFGLQPNHEIFNWLIKQLPVKNKHELYINIGSQKITEDKIKSLLKKYTKPKFSNFWKTKKTPKKLIQTDNTKFVISECCHPVPGDEVVIIENEGIKEIHRKECSVVKDKNQKATIFSWEHYKDFSFVSKIRFEAENRKGLLLDISKMLSLDFETDINAACISAKEKEFFVDGWLELKVLNKDHIEKICEKLKEIPGIKLVERIGNDL